MLDALRSRTPPFSPEAVAEEVAGFFKSYGVHTIAGNRYGGKWPANNSANTGS